MALLKSHGPHGNVMEPPEVTPPGLEGLVDPDPLKRSAAARALGGRPGHGRALADRLVAETHPRVRQALFTGLSRIGGDEAVDALLPLLRMEDAGLRNGAIEALGHMPESIAPRIDRLLRDHDPDVRIFTVNLLGDLVHPHLAVWLDQVLAQEQHPNVVAAALEVLAEVGSPGHARVLREVIERFPDEPFIGFAAEVALSRIEPS